MGHNATPNTHTPESTPIQEVTQKPPDLDVFFNLPFGCPVVINKEVGRTSAEGGTFQVINDFGVALGDNPTGNGSIEVYIPGKHGRDFYERKNVIALPLAYTQLSSQEKECFLPTIGMDSSINFYSPVSSAPDNPLSAPLEGSTLGNRLFGVEDFLVPPPPPPISLSKQHPVDITPLPEVTSSSRYPSRERHAPDAINLLASASLSDYAQHIFDPYDPMFDIDFERLPLEHMCQVPSSYSTFQSDMSNLSSAALPSPSSFSGGARKVHTETNPTVRQARLLLNWNDWKKAILAELIALRETGTYEEVKRRDIPDDARILHTKMDLKVKFNTAGDFTKYKARLVVLGNTEPADERNDFAPTANQKSNSILFAIAAQNKMKISGLDIQTAFLTATIDSDVYLRLACDLPLPLHSDGKEAPEGATYWRLKKTLYGLRRSPSLFNAELHEHLESGGYERSEMDQCLYLKRDPISGKLLFFTIHVDDFAIASECEKMTETLHGHIKVKYKIDETDTLEHFIGVNIS